MGRFMTPVRIKVAGRGAFPTDMLRYDLCCPANPDTVARIERSLRDPKSEGRVYELVCFSSSGPTYGRWSSFLFTCEKID